MNCISIESTELTGTMRAGFNYVSSDGFCPEVLVSSLALTSEYDMRGWILFLQ